MIAKKILAFSAGVVLIVAASSAMAAKFTVEQYNTNWTLVPRVVVVTYQGKKPISSLCAQFRTSSTVAMNYGPLHDSSGTKKPNTLVVHMTTPKDTADLYDSCASQDFIKGSSHDLGNVMIDQSQLTISNKVLTHVSGQWRLP